MRKISPTKTANFVLICIAHNYVWENAAESGANSHV
jgi:hypothetical protein